MKLPPVTRPIIRPICQSITGALGGGFSPISLFSGTDKGYIFDNNDLSSFYLDSNATTPATVNGLVGFQYDKSQGMVLSAERLTNGDFSSGTGWTLATGGGGTAVISGGLLSLAGGSATFPNATQSAVLTVGKLYRITIITTSSVTAGSIGVRVGSVSNNGPNLSTAGTYTATVLADGVDFRIIRNSGFTDTLDVDSVTIQEVLGNHRYQTTTGSKPILRGTPVGSNLVTNGDFATDTVWTKDAGWTISAGTASKAAGSAANIAQPMVLDAGRIVRVVYTISSISGGAAFIRLIGGAVVDGISRTTAGTFTEYLTVPATMTSFAIRGASTTVATIDNIEIVDVSADAVTAPYGIQYDGIDDFLTTASVDFTATDKMAVVMGVRKLSDAALGMFAELSVSADVNNGTFFITAPSAAGLGRYRFTSRGTAFSQPSAIGYDAPITNVVTGLGDIANDGAIIRVNGVQAGTASTDQGTGNYGNYPLYFGRRGGTTLPFNGLDFGGICVNKTLTASQLSSAERWTASRTGVTL